MTNKIRIPKFNIGDQVKLQYNHESDKSYTEKKIVRYLITKLRKNQKQCPMHPEHKRRIREQINAIRNAPEVRVIGIVADHGLNVDFVAHETYIKGIPGAASPLSHMYQLAFFWKNEDNADVAFVPKVAVFSEYMIVAA